MAGRQKSDEMRTALLAIRKYFTTAGLFSLGINLLFSRARSTCCRSTTG